MSHNKGTDRVAVCSAACCNDDFMTQRFASTCPLPLPSDDGDPELKGWPSLFPMTQVLQIGYFALEYEDLSPGCRGGCWRPSGARGSGVPGTKNHSDPQPLCVPLRTRTCQFPNIYFLPRKKDMGILIFKKQRDLETLFLNERYFWSSWDPTYFCGVTMDSSVLAPSNSGHFSL